MTTSYPAGRPGVQISFPNVTENLRQVAQGVNRLMQGHGNWTAFVTLAPNAGSTVVTDTRISGATFAGVMPQTPHAAAEIAAGTMSFVCGDGTLTITHANNAETDRTFTMCMIG